MIDSVKKIFDLNPINKVLGNNNVPVVVDDGPEPEPQPTPAFDKNYMCFENIESTTNTVTIEKVGNPEEDLILEYTKGGEGWTNVDTTGEGVLASISLAPGEKLWWRGIGDWGIEGSTSLGYNQFIFQSTGGLNLTGNILSVWDKNVFDTMTEMPKGAAFRGFKKYVVNNNGVLEYSPLKIVNADLTFDKITTITQTNYTAGNQSFVYSIFAQSMQCPNTYLKSCKIGFGQTFTINTVNGNTAARSPFASLFAHCTALTEVWLPNWTGTGQWSQANFTDGVLARGTMYIPDGKNVSRAKTGCPTNWTVKHYNPETGEVID